MNNISNLFLDYQIKAVISLVGLFLSSTILFAQSHEHEHLCGFRVFNSIENKVYLENTKRLDPLLYNKMQKEAEAKNQAREFKIYDELNFKVLSQITQSYVEVPATLKYEGDKVRIWVENKEIARINSTTLTNNINQIAEALQTKTSAKSRNPSKGIITNDEEVFGEAPSKYKFNNKTDFLLTDIKQPNGAGVVLGYFSKNDQSDEVGSNKLNILYIDSKEGFSSGITSLLNTVAHEYQHLIHFGKNENSEISVNEGCSEVASILCGYPNRGNSTYFKSTNSELFRWTFENSNDLIVDYERMMTFFQYFYEQVGEKGLTQVVKTDDFGKDRIDIALSAIGSNLRFNGLIENYSLALYLQTHSNPLYAFKQKLTASSLPKPTQVTYTGTNYPLTNSVVLQGHGIQYFTFNNPKGIKIKFQSGNSTSINAIMYRGADIVEIRKLKLNKEDCLVDRSYFDKIVIAVCNLELYEGTLLWSASECIAGVEEYMPDLKTEVLQTKDNLKINITSRTNIEVNCNIYDINGIKKVDKTFQILLGNNTENFDILGLNSGVYFIEIKTTQGKLIQKFLIEK